MTRQEAIAALKEEKPFITNQQLVYQIVLDEILALKMKSGDRISQGRLSSDFNLSRGPVKSALEKLAEDGFVTRDESGNFTVAQRTARLTTNVLSFKRQLDLLAVNQAMYDMTPKDYAQAQKMLEDMERAAQENDSSGFCRSDVGFHMVFVNAGGNPLLIKTYERYQKLFFFQGVVGYDPEASLHSRMLHVHKEIYKAVHNHDFEKAKAAVDSHYTSMWF